MKRNLHAGIRLNGGLSLNVLTDDEVDFCEKALGAHDVSQQTVPLHNAEAKWILENHTPDPLPDDILRKIRAIIAEREKEMGIKKGDNN